MSSARCKVLLCLFAVTWILVLQSTKAARNDRRCRDLLRRLLRNPPNNIKIAINIALSKARYICHEGFKLVGKEVRTCKGGKWRENVEPTCLKPCGKPEDIPHSKVVGSSFNFNDQLRYECIKGYTLTGPKLRTCGNDGKWSEAPRCKETISCGQSFVNARAKIVGGTISQRGMWPWQIAIYRINKNVPQFSCGGVLVSRQWVLTAAHCFYDAWGVFIGNANLYLIKAGDHNLSVNETLQQQVVPKRIFVHPIFKSSGLPFFDGDIALIKLNQEVELSKFVRTVCLPEKSEGDLAIPKTRGTVAGWGVRRPLRRGEFAHLSEISKVLRHVSFPIQSDQLCRNKSGIQFNTTTAFCAGDGRGGEDACQGDSGGAFVWELGNSKWVVIGVVSWGNGCAQKDQYGYYTRIYPFLDWIKETMNEKKEPANNKPANQCSSQSTKQQRRRGINLNEDCGLDLVFLFDASVRVNKFYFQTSLEFAKELLTVIGASKRSARTQVAAVTEAKLEFNLGDSKADTIDKAIKAIDNIMYVGWISSYIRPFKLVRNKVAPNSRNDSHQVMMFITDGLDLSGSVQREAKYLRDNKHFEVYAIGIGRKVKTRALISIASANEEHNHVISVREYRNLQEAVGRVVHMGIGRSDLASCQSPGGIAHGKKFGSDYSHNKTVRYECDAEYTLEGKNKLTCNDGKWNYNPPQCKAKPPDPCKTVGCKAPYNIGCRTVNNTAECICPTCPDTLNPVCTSDDVQDRSECHMKRQSCVTGDLVTVTKRAPCDKECKPIADIGFVIDSSGSIGRGNWGRMKRFLKALVSKLDVSPSTTHISAVAYSNNPEVVLRFRNRQSTEEVNNAFDGMRWQRGFTYTDKALLLTDSDLFQTANGMRPNVGKALVVITDGKKTTSNSYMKLSVAYQGVKNAGIAVYAIGVGNGADAAELREIASSQENVFISTSFKELQTLAVEIRKRLCEVRPPPTTLPTTTPKPTEFVCEAVADVAFLVDSSGSIGRRNWGKMLQFLKDMVKAFNVGPDKTHIAIVAYSTRAVLEFKFDRLKGSQVTEAGYNSLIDGIHYQRGFTFIDKALMLADEQVFQRSAGMRPDLPQIAIVITDGKQTTDRGPYRQLADASSGLKLKKVQVYSVGIGTYRDQKQLEYIASSKDKVFFAPSFAELTPVAQEIVQNSCPEQKKAVCPDPGVPSQGMRVGDNFQDGKTVTFECKKNYDLLGNSTIRCNGGVWNSETPKCKGRCNYSGNPNKGYTTTGSFRRGELLPHGTIAEYACNVSYTLTGSKILHCDDGTWNGSLPSCKASCDDPGTIAQARKIGNDYSHGQIVTYECITQGYSLVGNPTLTCNDGSWDSQLPQCKVRSQCGADLTTESGVITSPRFPSRYPQLANCEWKISLDNGSRITLTFVVFEVEVSDKCEFDYLEVSNGEARDSAYQVAKLCGTELPEPITSSGPHLFLKFRSDFSVELKGFKLKFTKTALHNCGTTLSTLSGEINSPNYPQLYQPNRNCKWKISVPLGNHIQLAFQEINIEEGVTGKCVYDYVQVYSGIGKEAESLGRYCGKEDTIKLASTAHTMTVTFHSDNTLNSKGFKAMFAAVCGAQLQASNTKRQFISHPSYGNDNYEPNLHCIWQLTARSGYKIHLRLKEFDVEMEKNCAYDYVIIRDGNNTTAPLLGRLCGKGRPVEFVTRGNRMWIEFRTDLTTNKNGFIAEYWTSFKTDK